MIQFLKNKIRKFHVKPEHSFEKVLSINGKDFYKFTDISKTHCLRMHAANDYMNELSMRCSREYLLEHTKAMEAILSNPQQTNIPEIAKLHTQLKERLEMIYESDMVYKIAGALLFDKTENPYDFDFKYAQQKIKLFKEQRDAFFLTKLFKIIIGSPGMSDKDLDTYLKVGTLITQEHSENISTILSKNLKMTGINSMSKQQVEQG